jgi:hypothetical protein
MSWFAVWDDVNEDMESAWGVEADDAEEAAELYMEYGEVNSWWVGGDEYPDELVALEHAGTDREVRHIVDVTVDWSPTFTGYCRRETPNPTAPTAAPPRSPAPREDEDDGR